ncbi:hypothetical protein X739_32445 [Mesorhizobium sp. LNHC220B00]|uniref:multiubiquitin domain-containing protein n=1 Tax=Mesorhizobium sp. M0496 TaxID=2956952 RepID=UPI0003CE254C|nr:multiubiquitin domain-containing protein [Mesorhizobium sp. LNHC220B00]ESY77898.1 hypothetical protein X739_32445 [Mesorhizobium sp. LNHC220B00]
MSEQEHGPGGGNQGNGGNPAPGGSQGHTFDLIVNRSEYKWATETITGAQIKQLAGSPQDWVVNQIVPGPGEDPEIGENQSVHLEEKAPPPGRKRRRSSIC